MFDQHSVISTVRYSSSEVGRFKMRFIHGFILIVFGSLFIVVDAQGKFVYKDAANNIRIC